MSFYGYYNHGSYPSYHTGQNWTQGPPPSAPPTTASAIQFGSFLPGQVEQHSYPQAMYAAPGYSPYGVPMMAQPYPTAYHPQAPHMAHQQPHTGGPPMRDNRNIRKNDGRSRGGPPPQHRERDHSNRETPTHPKTTNIPPEEQQQQRSQHSSQQQQQHRRETTNTPTQPTHRSEGQGMPISSSGGGYVGQNIQGPPPMSAQMMHPHPAYSQMPFYGYPGHYPPAHYNMPAVEPPIEGMNVHSSYHQSKGATRLQLEPNSMTRSNVPTPTPTIQSQEANDLPSPKNTTAAKKRLQFVNPTTKTPIETSSDQVTSSMISDPSNRSSNEMESSGLQTELSDLVTEVVSSVPRVERSTSSKVVVSKVQRTELKTGEMIKKPTSRVSAQATGKKIIDPSNGAYQPGSCKTDSHKTPSEASVQSSKPKEPASDRDKILNTLNSIERREEKDGVKEEKKSEKRKPAVNPSSALEKEDNEEKSVPQSQLIFDRNNTSMKRPDHGKVGVLERRPEGVGRVVVGTRFQAASVRAPITEEKKEPPVEVVKSEVVETEKKVEEVEEVVSEEVKVELPTIQTKSRPESPDSIGKISRGTQSPPPGIMSNTTAEEKLSRGTQTPTKGASSPIERTENVVQEVKEKNKESLSDMTESVAWTPTTAEVESPMKEPQPQQQATTKRTNSGKLLSRSSSFQNISRKNSSNSIRGSRSVRGEAVEVFHVSSGKRKYTYEFLKRCRENFVEKPTAIENLACMKDFDGSGLKPSRSGSDKWSKQAMNRGGYEERGKSSLGRMNTGGGGGRDWPKDQSRQGSSNVILARNRLSRQYSGQRGGTEDSKWGKADINMISPFAPNSGSGGAPLHKTENKYIVGAYQTDDVDEEKRQKTFKGLLNKLTPDNFDKMFEKFMEVEISSATTLRGLIDQIFDKALIETTFCPLYSDLCKLLMTKMPEFEEEGDTRRISFRRLLLNKCQAEYEKGDAAIRAEKEAKVEDESISKEERLDRLSRARKERLRSLGNMQFIGFLFKKEMLTERIIHNCILDLLREDENPKPEDIECLCKLLSTVGELLPTDKNLDAYFSRIDRLSKNKKLETRHRFMLMDLIELKNRKWVERREKEGPKTIEEIHKEAMAEQQAQNARNRGGYATGGGDRRDVNTGGSFMNRSSRGGNAWNRSSSGNDRNPTSRTTSFTNTHEEVRPLAKNLSLGRTASSDISLRPGNMESKGPSSRPAVVSMPRPRSKSPTETQPSTSSSTVSKAQPSPIVEQQEEGHQDIAPLEGEELDRKVKTLLTEFYNVNDLEEVLRCIEELSEKNATKSDSLRSILLTGLDIRLVEVEQRLIPIIPIITALLSQKIFSPQDVKQGLRATMAALPEIAEDFPKAPVLIARMLGSLASDGIVPLKPILDPCKGIILGAGKEEKSEEDTPLVDSGHASTILIELLKQMKKEEKETGRSVREALNEENADLTLFYPSYLREETDLSEELQFLDN